MTTQQALETARHAHRAGRLAEAAACYCQILATDPCHADALHFLGVIAGQTGRHAEAVDWFRKSIAAKPDNPEACKNLGVALKAIGHADDAITACQQAISLKPDYAEAHRNLAGLLHGQGRLEDAIAAYRNALQLEPRLAAVWHNLAVTLHKTGRSDEAIAAYQKSVELRPDHAEAFARLGHALKEQCRIAEAIDAYRKAIELRPDSPDWQHVLAALSGDTSPTGTPASHVRKLFDPYADEFDVHLVEKLGYHVPEQLLEAVLTISPGRNFDILDLGCGTGLCGMQFRACAKSLSGVDLSRAMLAKAAARGIYDRLISGDILEGLRDSVKCFDLILAGDVFVYVGDLADTFHSAARALRSGGLLAFSLERHDGEGFMLHSQIRFAHSLAYIRALARAHGFFERLANEITVRMSGTAPVAGWLVVLQAD